MGWPRMRLALAGVLAASAAWTPAVASPDWVGRYRMEWMEGAAILQKQGRAAAPMQLLIERQPEMAGAPAEAKALYQLRVGEASAEASRLVPFHESDYGSLGLADLRAAQGIECLAPDAFLMICKTAPQTTVSFGKDPREQIVVRTGYFGIALHAGGFELTPLDKK